MTVTDGAEAPVLSDATIDYVTAKYFPRVVEDVRKRAIELAVSENKKPDEIHVFRACDEYFLGKGNLSRKRLWPWLEANFTGFMIITSILAIIFGYFGAVGGEEKNKEFLEIAKIFAGALVGAAAGAAATSLKR